MGKRGIILLCAGVLGLVVGLFLLLRPGPQPPPITQTLPDGSTLTLTGIKTGENVSFPHGSLFNRVLFQVLPTNGLRIGGRTLINRPNIATVLPQIKGGGLFLEFKTTPATRSAPPRPAAGWTRAASALPSAGNYLDSGSYFRFAIHADDGYLLYSPFSSRTNADGYRYAWIPVYQRLSKSLDVSLEQLENVPEDWGRVFVSSSGTIETVSTEGFISRVNSSVPPDLVWRSIARFPVSLPAAREQKWKVESLPARRTFGDIEIQLDQILVTEQPESSRTIDRFTGRMKFRVLGDTGVILRWLAAPIEITDSTGNTVVFTLSGMSVINPSPRQLYQQPSGPVPDPRFPWRVRMSVGRTTDFPQTNLVTFNLPLPPASNPTSTSLRAPTGPGSGLPPITVFPAVTNILTTNLLGVPVTVVFASSRVRFMLPESRTDLRLDLVAAVSDAGSRWNGGSSRSTEREAGFNMSRMRGATNFTITLAIHPNYPVEFIIRPTLQPSK